MAAIILIQRNGLEPGNLFAMVITLSLLLTKKVPAPLIVLAFLIAGFAL